MEWDYLDFETLEGWLIQLCLTGGLDPALQETEGFHACIRATAADSLLRQREQWEAGEPLAKPLMDRGSEGLTEKERLVSAGRQLFRRNNCWRTLSG